MSQTKAQLLDPVDLTIVTDDIADGAINNAKVNASAAIAGSKISPNFGSQNISTTGHIDLGDASTIKLGDSDELQIQHTAGGASLISETGSGNLEIRATNINLKDSNANDKLATNSLGVAITGNLDVSNGLDVTGAITATGDITINESNPVIFFNDTGDNPDYEVGNHDGAFVIQDNTNSANRLVVNTDGHIDIAGNVDFGAGIDVTGTTTTQILTTTGTVSFNSTSDNVNFTGASHHALWLPSQNAFRWNDNSQAHFGTAADLKIYHDASNSYIADVGTGNLSINSSNGEIQLAFNDFAGNFEHMVRCVVNNQVELYYDGSLKFATTSIGATVTGSLTSDELKLGNTEVLRWGSSDTAYIQGQDGVSGYMKFAVNSVHMTINRNGTINLPDSNKITFGADNDLQLFHDGSNSYLLNQTGNFIVKNNTGDFIKNIGATGAVELSYNNSKKFETVSNGVKVTSQLETTGDIVCGAELNLMGSSDAAKYLDCRVGSNAFNIRKTTGGDSNHETMAKFHGDGGVELYHNNVSKFITTATGATLTGALAVVNTGNASLVLDADSSQAGTQISFVDFKLDGTVEANIAVNESVSGNPLELNSATNHNVVLVTGGGKVGINNNSPTAHLDVTGSIRALSDSENNVVLTNTGSIELTRQGGAFIDFANGGTEDHDCRIKQESNGFAFITGGNGSATEKMRISSAGGVGISTSAPQVTLDVGGASSGGINGLTNPVFYAGFTNNTSFGGVVLGAGANGNTPFIAASKKSDGTALPLDLMTNATSRMRLTAGGKILIARTNEDGSGVINLALNSSGHGISTRTGSNSTQTHLDFGNQNGVVGSIQTNGSNTSFNTSSDYRLKENAVAISDGITRLKTLKPYRFNFKADASTTLDGFFAHEVTAVPEAISGTKDAVDEDNNPVYQGIDQSKIVPLLVAALQELIGRVETLETA